MRGRRAWLGVCSLLLLTGASPAPAAGEVVTLADFSVLRRSFHCFSGDPCYEPSADYDEDGLVGIKDFLWFKVLFRLGSSGADSTPPVISITNPAINQVLRRTIQLSVSATDDIGVRDVSIFVEGMEPFPHENAVGLAQRTLDTRTIPNGVQVIRADARDFSGNLASHRIAVRIDNPPPPTAGSAPGVVILDDLNGDGRHTGEDVKIGLALCVPGCTLRALARTYDDVEVALPAGLTGAVIIEGAGMGQTVFRSPVPWGRPVFTVSYPNPLVTFRDLTIDGRKGEQVSSYVSWQSQVGIRVVNGVGLDSGPGVIERVEIKNMLNEGIGISGGTGWIVRHSRIHDNGCSTRFPCPSLRAVDLGAALHDPTWQSVGYGIVVEASDTTVHDSEIWNVNKIGIEAFDSVLLPYAELMSGFHFHHNYVHHVGEGIGSNGGRGGRIGNNTITFAKGYGVFCGGQAGDLVFDDNFISDSDFAGIWVSCWGPNITVTNNRVGNNCWGLPGGASGLLVDAGTQFGGGDGLTVANNLIVEPNCRSASEISYRDGIQIAGNEFQGGTALGTLVLHDASNIVLSDTHIDADHRVPAGVFLIANIDGLLVRSDVGITGYTQRKFQVADPGSLTNVVVEY